MKINVTCLRGLIALIMILSLGLQNCSNMVKPVKPDNIVLDSLEKTEHNETDRFASVSEENFQRSYKSLETPVFEDIMRNSDRFGMSIESLKKEIILYRQLYGVLPDTISDLVDKGFLIYWPRNPLNGQPARLLGERELVKDPSDFGSFKYRKFNNSKASLSYLRIDNKIYRDSGRVIWVEENSIYDCDAQMYKGWKYIMGGTQRLEDITDEEKKLIIVMCANFNRILFSKSTVYYSHMGRLPESFSDIIFNDKYFISENFETFVSQLKNSNTDLRWGCDHHLNALYITSDIEGERFIEFRADYGDYDGSLSNTGLYPGKPPYNMDEIDTSMPIITSENLDKIIIPDNYLISTHDIPLHVD